MPGDTVLQKKPAMPLLGDEPVNFMIHPRPLSSSGADWTSMLPGLKAIYNDNP
jgi:hypothetical protein